MGNFLLVDLSEKKTKKLAETITSDTSRKILDYLAGKEHDSESSIAKSLGIAISTVHYHLGKLVEAKLVEIKTFHYSSKGREVNHYSLANKYIIIAPKKVSGLREKLKGILPLGIVFLGISAVLKFVQNTGMKNVVMESAPKLMQADMVEAVPMMAKAVEPMAQQPDIALWFLIGGVTVIVLSLLLEIIKKKIN